MTVPGVFKIKHVSAWLLCALLQAFLVSARAQVVPTASLSGTVTDPVGAVVPAASVSLRNSETQLVKSTKTDAIGRFLFTPIPPGQYELNVSAVGFSTYDQTGITLSVNVAASVQVVLGLARLTQEVLVQADVPMVDTQSGTLRRTVNEQYIQNLPLNGRNAAQLVFMASGAVSGKGQTPATYANQASEALPISVNGTYGNQVSYKLDGASHQDSISGLNAVFPNPDALGEFSVQTNNFDARYGGSGGAVVNIVTKSGTNRLRGSAFEYLRNAVLNARNFFSPQRDSLKRSQFGGALGGPIIRNKLFFFGNYQGTTVRNIAFGRVAFVPSVAMRQGDFSSLKTLVRNPRTGKPFEGNRILGEMISPIAKNALGKVPMSSDAKGMLQYGVPGNLSKHQALGKINYNIGPHMLAGSFFYDWFSDPGWDAARTLLNYRLGQLQTAKEFNVSDTFTLTPKLVNTVVFNALFLNSTQVRTAPYSIFDFGDIKVAKPVPEFLETQISVTNFSGWGGGGPAPPGQWTRNNFEVSDVLTYSSGGHTMHMGIEITPRFGFDSSTGFQEEPTFTFNGQATGHPLADFLLGEVAVFTQTAGKAKFTRGKGVRLYFQDDWRVTPNFSIWASAGTLTSLPTIPWPSKSADTFPASIRSGSRTRHQV